MPYSWKEGPSHGALIDQSPGLALSLLLTGCFGAYNPTGAGSLTPVAEDKDAGLVGIAGGFDLETCEVIAVSLFPVTDPSIKDEGDRRLASSMSAFFQSELVRRLRESGLFARVVNLTETSWQPGKDHRKESFDDMARDLARFPARLSRGEAPRKE